MTEMRVPMPWSPRGKLLLLAGVFLAPVVAAYLAYFGWRPAGHGNYGELLAVTPLQRTAGVTRDGRPFDLVDLRGKWLMVRVGPAACSEDCERQLYLMRQIRIALGKDQSRIERVWVVSDAGTVAPARLREHPGLHVWHPAEAAFTGQFPVAREGARHIYVVDPLGNLMLRFPDPPAPKRVMKDMRLLLKASQAG